MFFPIGFPGKLRPQTVFTAVVKSLGLPLITLSSLSLRQKIRQKSADVESARQEFDSRVLELLTGYEVTSSCWPDICWC